MSRMLVGFTGFVGSNLTQQMEFDYLVNSSNIFEFAGASVDELIISAGDARKWLANEKPDNDLNHINKLFADVSKIKAKKVVLFSTVDVYEEKKRVHEGSFLVSNQAYGKHRWQFEQQILAYFEHVKIIRLPGLFGNGLKKNLIFDISVGKDISGFNPDSAFQWFHLSDLKMIVDFCYDNDINEINVTSEPVSVRELCNYVNVDLELLDENAPKVKYDIHSIHANKYSGHNYYLMNSL